MCVQGQGAITFAEVGWVCSDRMCVSSVRDPGAAGWPLPPPDKGGLVGRMMAITELPPSPSPITAGSMAGPSCGSEARLGFHWLG